LAQVRAGSAAPAGMSSPSSCRTSKVGFEAEEVSFVQTVDRDAGVFYSPTSPPSPYDPDAVAVYAGFSSRRKRQAVGFSLNRDVTLKCWRTSGLMQKRYRWTPQDA